MGPPPLSVVSDQWSVVSKEQTTDCSSLAAGHRPLAASPTDRFDGEGEVVREHRRVRAELAALGTAQAVDDQAAGVANPQAILVAVDHHRLLQVRDAHVHL